MSYCEKQLSFMYQHLFQEVSKKLLERGFVASSFHIKHKNIIRDSGKLTMDVRMRVFTDAEDCPHVEIYSSMTMEEFLGEYLYTGAVSYENGFYDD